MMQTGSERERERESEREMCVCFTGSSSAFKEETTELCSLFFIWSHVLRKNVHRDGVTVNR